MASVPPDGMSHVHDVNVVLDDSFLQFQCTRSLDTPDGLLDARSNTSGSREFLMVYRPFIHYGQLSPFYTACRGGGKDFKGEGDHQIF